MPSVKPSSSVGVVTTPLVHTASVTVGATGDTCAHDAAASVTVKVAVLFDVSVQLVGITPHSKPSAKVAVIVTTVVTVPTYGPAGTAT